MARLATLVALVASLPAVASSGGGAWAPLPSAWCGMEPSSCRTLSFSDLLAQAQANCADTSAAVVLESATQFCRTVCSPGPRQADYRDVCMSHSYHSFQSSFREALIKRQSLMWPIFFLIWSVLLGSFLSRMFPKWLPYTVGLLVFGIMLGAVAQRLEVQQDCPMYARLFDYDGDSRVSREEWDMFVCKGCNAASFCADHESASLLSASQGVQVTAFPVTCFKSGCGYTFEELDKPWKLSAMLAESTYAFPHSSSDGAAHRRLSAATGDSDAPPSLEGDGYLDPDELWTSRCNLMRDFLSLMDIDPHLMLVVFLPALLFESACFGIDMGIFRKQIAQICLMAFPAMVLASFITALCLYALAPSTWTIWVCWLIGIIASATDPVAVVALLKELGAAKTLGTLIEGESLLNDGSAVVLFTWVRNVIGYDYATLPPSWMQGTPFGERYTGQVGTELVRVVAQMLIFGVILGTSFGWMTCFLLGRLYNVRYVEVSMVVTMTYLVFWLGELVMGSSAVLAVVVMGLYVNNNRSSISPSVLHFLHEFYEMVAFFLNTVIFVIAGCKLGALMADSSFHSLYATGSGSLGMIVGIYPIILFARGVAILLFFPLLRYLGTGCTWKEAVVMWWGGLRGSVGLALGLAVHHTLYDKKMWGEGANNVWGQELPNPSLDCRDQPMMVLILTLYVVTTTVIINGMTMAPLMRFLKLTEVPEDRQFMLQRARGKLAFQTFMWRAKMQEKLGSFLSDVNWAEVRGSSFAHAAAATCTVGDIEKASWMLVLSLERAYYTASFEAGSLSDMPFRTIERTMADICAEASVSPTAMLSAVYDKHFEELLTKLQQRRPEEAYEVGLAYIAAQHEVDHLTKNDASEEMKTLLRKHLAGDGNQTKIEKIQAMLEALRAKAPKAVQAFQTKYVTTALLRKQRQMVEHMKHEGELLDLDAAPLTSEIDDDLALRIVGRTPTIKVGADSALNEVSKFYTLGTGMAGMAATAAAHTAGAAAHEAVRAGSICAHTAGAAAHEAAHQAGKAGSMAAHAAQTAAHTVVEEASYIRRSFTSELKTNSKHATVAPEP